jgi:hypothetical protein
VASPKTINKNRDELNIAKFDEAKVSEGLAVAHINLEIGGTIQSNAVKALISDRMEKRNETNKVPSIIVYANTAPSKNNTPEHTAPVVYNNVERAL